MGHGALPPCCREYTAVRMSKRALPHDCREFWIPWRALPHYCRESLGSNKDCKSVLCRLVAERSSECVDAEKGTIMSLTKKLMVVFPFLLLASATQADSPGSYFLDFPERMAVVVDESGKG